MVVTNDIKDDVYKKLINYVFEKCDAVMFIFRKDGFDKQNILQLNNSLNQIKKELSLSLLKHRNGAYWVYSKVDINN